MHTPSAVVALVLLATTAHTATIRVPGSAPTISAALSTAAFGDTVVVAAGTYPEFLTLVDGVQLHAADLLDRPVLDGGHSGIPLTAVSCGALTVVRGFVIRHGAGRATGGGAFLSDSDVLFRECRFEGNAAISGGAIGAERSGFTLVDCEFLQNTASEAGGAVSMTGGGRARIVNCSFESNDSVAGGAIAIRNGSSPSIQMCVFDANAARVGAALWFDLLTGGWVEQNTIVFSADRDAGGALYIDAIASPHLVGNIIAFGEGRGIFAAPGARAVYECNDVFGNTLGNKLGGGTDLGNNLSADPLFCDMAAGDYSLHPVSPCLPSGSCGLIGGIGPGECQAVSVESGVEPVHWGSVKSRYRSGLE